MQYLCKTPWHQVFMLRSHLINTYCIKLHRPCSCQGAQFERREKKPFFFKLPPFPSCCCLLGNLSKTAEDDDDNVGKTIRLITQDKKCTWICQIRLTFLRSCSRVGRQLLHFHVVCKTWPIFQQLSSIFSVRKRRWKQLKFSENKNKQCNQSKAVT